MIESIDHLVLTVRDIAATVSFYEKLLGMKEARFTAADGTVRVSLAFGNQKINLHEAGREFEPKALRPAPGSADLCFLTREPIAAVQARLQANGADVVEGPVRRTGATGPILSVYIRDPDGNLVEIANQLAVND